MSSIRHFIGVNLLCIPFFSTQDNTFWVLDDDTLIQIDVGTKKVTTQKSLAGRSPNFRLQTLDRGGSCQSGACDSLVRWEKNKVRLGSWTPEVSQHERVTRGGRAGWGAAVRV